MQKKPRKMRITFIYIFIPISNLTFGQTLADTITNWQIYKDNDLILAGNIAMERTLLPITSIDITEKYENIKLVFFTIFVLKILNEKLIFILMTVLSVV